MVAPHLGIAWVRGHSHIRVRAFAQKFMSSGYNDKLMQNWELAREKKPLNSIAPLM